MEINGVINPASPQPKAPVAHATSSADSSRQDSKQLSSNEAASAPAASAPQQSSNVDVQAAAASVSFDRIAAGVKTQQLDIAPHDTDDAVRAAVVAITGAIASPETAAIVSEQQDRLAHMIASSQHAAQPVPEPSRPVAPAPVANEPAAQADAPHEPAPVPATAAAATAEQAAPVQQHVEQRVHSNVSDVSTSSGASAPTMTQRTTTGGMENSTSGNDQAREARHDAEKYVASVSHNTSKNVDVVA